MTTSTLRERLEQPVLTPAAAKAAQLADLLRRMARAEEIAAEAEAVEDWKKFGKAMVKLHLRQIQHQFLLDRPEGAICPRCRYGESGWSKKAMTRGEVWESCLGHYEDLHLNRARELAERECEDLEGVE